MRVPEEDFLYVGESEVAEALALGARFIEGDARMVRPRPLPVKVDPAAFDRWRTPEARYAWSMAYMARLIGDFAPVETLEDTFQSGTGQEAHERVYLWVPSYDIEKVRKVAGVTWDKRRRMYYAAPGTDLRQLFVWLTPAARSIFEAERAVQKAIHLLVKERALKEVAARNSAGGGQDVSRGEAADAKSSSTPTRREGSRTQAD